MGRFSSGLLIFTAFVIHTSTLCDDASTLTPESFPDVVEKIRPAVAYIVVPTNIRGLDVTGTAFLIDSSGILATCRHVLIDTFKTKITVIDSVTGNFILVDTFAVTDETRAAVVLPGNSHKYSVSLVAERVDRDVALIRLLRPSGDANLSWRVVSTGNVSDIQEGLSIGCTGYDLDQKDERFSEEVRFIKTTRKGIVSAVVLGPRENLFTDAFQLDMLVNHGASGAPVYRASDGLVLGLVQSVKIRRIGEDEVGLGIAICQPIWVAYNLFVEEVGRNPSGSKAVR